MKVLSLFDGISCGYEALNRASIHVDSYDAYEIDKYAIGISKFNHPDINHKGDVFKANYSEGQYDMVIGGSPCFIAGTMVKARDGYKEIQDIRIGDYVLTHKGRYKRVTGIMAHETDQICKINTEAGEPIYCTPNHRFYTRLSQSKKIKGKHNRIYNDFEWTKVEDFFKNRNEKGRIKSQTTLTSVTDTEYHDYNYNGYDIYQNATKFIHSKNLPLNNKNFWILIGKWLGDGWVSYSYKNGRKRLSGIRIAFEEKERNEIENLMESLGYNYCISKERTCCKLHISNLELALFVSEFGIGAENKHLTSDCYYLKDELMECLLKGYFSTDGYLNKYGKQTACSISRQLIYGIKYCYEKLYKLPADIKLKNCEYWHIEGRSGKAKPSYHFTADTQKRNQSHFYVDNNYISVQYKNVEYLPSSRTIVYNMSVEEDESYTANGKIVHNCTFWSIAKKDREIDNTGNGYKLFSEYVRAINTIKPKYFIYENNYSIHDNIKNIISKELGVQPIMIDSALFSAQSRKRCYWTNIPVKLNVFDNLICINDIVEDNVNYTDYSDITKFNIKNKIEIMKPIRIGTIGKGGQGERVYSSLGKSVTLSANGGGRGAKTGLYSINGIIRKLSPLESEKLQTLPDNYTKFGIINNEVVTISDKQRYKCIGNGWTVDVISYILSFCDF